MGVGLDTVHGIGDESLAKCVEYVLTDARCDGTGYFDAEDDGDSYQCKCPTSGSCLANPQPHDSWKIYKTSKPSFLLIKFPFSSLSEW